jgi:SsrA-binding protein
MKIFAKNKKAQYNFEILNIIEAGIELLGPEVKQIRNSRVNLKGSFCKFFKNELFLIDCHINRSETVDAFSKIHQTDEVRPRKLLLHRKELNKLYNRVQLDGLSIICTEIYSNEKNKIKCTINLAKGKKLYDKRSSDKEKSLKREIQQNKNLILV